jgi:hypothetical protein
VADVPSGLSLTPPHELKNVFINVVLWTAPTFLFSFPSFLLLPFFFSYFLFSLLPSSLSFSFFLTSLLRAVYDL